MTTTRQRKSSRLRHLVLPAVTLAYLGYFGFHTFNGYYGLWSRAELLQQEAQLGAELKAVSAERTRMLERVVLMRPDSLETDMLDERAREALNVVRADELLIYAAPQHTQR